MVFKCHRYRCISVYIYYIIICLYYTYIWRKHATCLSLGPSCEHVLVISFYMRLSLVKHFAVSILSFNIYTVLSFLAICTASISKGIKTALHSGSLLRRSSLSLLRFNIQGYWSNWTESFSQTGYMKPQTTPSELPPFNKGGPMAKSSWLVVPKKVSDIEEWTLKSHTGTWLKAWHHRASGNWLTDIKQDHRVPR